MKIEDIKKIEQTADTIDVNDFLKEGYKIIKIFHQHIETQDGEQSFPVYVLGKGE